MSDCPDQAGFTVIEVLVAAFVLVVGMLGVALMLDTANRTTGVTLSREGATTLARDVLERAHSVSFDLAGTTSFGPALRTALPDGAAATVTDPQTFTLARRHTSYTVAISSCKVDDPADGVGVHDASYCDFASGGCPQASCGNPAPGAPTGSAVTLKLLGIPIAVPVSGALVDTTICGLLGANPIGSNATLDSLLGRGGTVNGLLSLVNSGADVSLCQGSTGQDKYALDRVPGDFAKVLATVSWTDGNGRTQSLRQSAMIANPGGV